MFEIDKILERLPSNYIKNTASNLSNLFKIFRDKLNEILQTKEDIKQASEINNATGFSLDRLGKNVQQPRGGLSDAKYRSLIKSKISSNLSAGDINSLIEYLAAILDLNREDILIRQNIYRDFRIADGDDVQKSELHGYSSLTFIFDDETTLDDTTSLDDAKTFDTQNTDGTEFFEYLFDFVASYENTQDSGEFFEPAHYNLQVPLDQVAFSKSEIVDIAKRISAAGVRVNYID